MRRISIRAIGVFAFATTPAFAGTFTITTLTNPNRYEPSTLTINVGDTVTFTNTSGFHNVVSDADSVTAFRCANGCDATGGNGDPSGPGWTADVTFPTAGTAPFHCEVHGLAMAGTITIVGTPPAPAISVDPTSLTGTADAGASVTTFFSIANSGDAVLDWSVDTATASCDSPEVVPWLAMDPGAGSVQPGDPTVNVAVGMDATGLDAGVYEADVCVHSNDPVNDPLTLPVTFTVTVPDLIFGDGFDP